MAVVNVAPHGGLVVELLKDKMRVKFLECRSSGMAHLLNFIEIRDLCCMKGPNTFDGNPLTPALPGENIRKSFIGTKCMAKVKSDV